MEEPSQLAVIPKGGLWGNRYPDLPFLLAPVSRRSFPLAKHNKRQKARGACWFSHRIQLSGLQRRNGKGGRWYLERWTEDHRSRFCPWISYSTLRNIPETSSYTCAQGGICKVVYAARLRIEKKWKQPYCSLLSCYIAVLNKLWVICRMKWHIDIKVDELEIHVSVL